MNLEQALNSIKRLNRRFPKEELLFIRKHKEEAIPFLLKNIEEVANNENNFKNKTGDLYDFDEIHDVDDHIYSLFLLAEFRVQDAFEPIIKILAFEPKTIEWYLDQILYLHMNKIVNSVSSKKDIERIKAVVENDKLYTYQRTAALDVLEDMMKRGLYSLKDFNELISSLLLNYNYSENYVFESEDEFIDILLYRYSDIFDKRNLEIVDKLFENGTIADFLVTHEMIKESLLYDDIYDDKDHISKKLESKYEDLYVVDTIEDLSKFLTFQTDIREIQNNYTKPNVIELKNKVGRNDPCPCGSGKKFKKCCNY